MIDKLFMTEKQQALMTMALDRYVAWMHETNCCATAIDMFEQLEKWVRNYDLHFAAEAAKAWQYVSELGQGDGDFVTEARIAVDEMDDDQVDVLYDIVCERLGELYEPATDTQPYKDPRQTDLEEAIKAKEEELAKLKASQVPTEVNPNELYPSDVEPKDESDPKIIDVVFGGDPYLSALRSLQVDAGRR